MIPISNSVIDVVFPARSSKLTLKGIVSPFDGAGSDPCVKVAVIFVFVVPLAADPDNSSTASIAVMSDVIESSDSISSKTKYHFVWAVFKKPAASSAQSCQPSVVLN